MIRKKRMGKGIAKILSGLLVFGMVAGLVPAVPGGTVNAKATEINGQNATAEPHTHCVCGTGNLSVERHTHKEETWTGISKLSDINREGNYYLTQDVTLTSAWTCQRNVNLCLNGHSITRTAKEYYDQNGNNAVIIIKNNVDFTLTDCKGTGTITHKQGVSGEGVYNDGRFFMYNGIIFGNNGGVKNPGMFFMYGGTITSNTANNGGGVDNAGTFTMDGGTITSNTANNGGGVYNDNAGRFIMYGGTITGNKAEQTYGTEYGGGVYNQGTFNMYGGEITNNTATVGGGGVFNKGTFTMSGGEITSNSSESYGGGVCYSSSQLFKMSGTVNITENKVGTTPNNLYLWNGQQVSASGLTSGAEIGVTTQIVPINDSSVPITSDSVSVNCFFSDNSDYETAIDENSKVVLKTKTAVEAPSITKQPQPVSVKVGETATFTVVAAGTDLSYQWRVNKNDNAGFVDIVGANSESYTLNAVSKDCNGYQYQCVVSNAGDSVTSGTVTLTVTEDAAPTPNPNPTPTPEPNPEPNPEPTPTPTPNPAPEPTTPTPDPAPATSTPATSTTTAPASSAAAAPAQVTYDILDGAGSSWTQNTDGSLAIRGSGEISKFRAVKVDGVTVDPVNYTVTEGSTIITFKPEYLKSLSAGNHSFELIWTDGTAATNFTVAENADQSAKSPKTGEDFSRTLCTVLLMVSCVGLAGMLVRRKKSSLR